VCRSHAGLHRAERMLDRLAPQAHRGIRATASTAHDPPLQRSASSIPPQNHERIITAEQRFHTARVNAARATRRQVRSARLWLRKRNSEHSRFRWRSAQNEGSPLHAIQASRPEPRIIRCEFSEHEWTAIKPMLLNKPRGVRRGR
jgi:hypothetical protein